MDANELFLKKKKAKKEARRNKTEEEANLGMTSLMDIVSIIVVYLLKSYASDPVLIQPIAEQKIPLSRADTPIQTGVAVYISSKELIFNEKKVVTLKDGELNENDVKGHTITALYEKMVEEAEAAKEMAEARQTEWEGRIILIGDQSLKFKTIVDVMFTAGRAKYTEYAFCVIKQGPG